MAVVPVDPQPTAPAEPTAPGVRLDPSLSFEAWRLLGAGLSTGYDESCWALGDWVAFGRARYGRFYRDALFATGLDHATLGGYAAVARRFTPARRRADVTLPPPRRGLGRRGRRRPERVARRRGRRAVVVEGAAPARARRRAARRPRATSASSSRPTRPRPSAGARRRRTAAARSRTGSPARSTARPRTPRSASERARAGGSPSRDGPAAGRPRHGEGNARASRDRPRHRRDLAVELLGDRADGFTFGANSTIGVAIDETREISTTPRPGIAVFLSRPPGGAAPGEIENLEREGYHDWAGRSSSRPAPRSRRSPTERPRAAIEQQGYRIIANIGDQYSDLAAATPTRVQGPEPFPSCPDDHRLPARLAHRRGELADPGRDRRLGQPRVAEQERRRERAGRRSGSRPACSARCGGAAPPPARPPRRGRRAARRSRAARRRRPGRVASGSASPSAATSASRRAR